MSETPKIVCLCGSTRFKEEFIRANRDETLKGNIVLSVGMFGHQEGIDMNGPVKQKLDELHLRKIDRADEVLVLNVGNYIGESTRREIYYAASTGKPVRYLEPVDGPPGTKPPDQPTKELMDWVSCLEQLHAKFGDMPAIVKSWPAEQQNRFFQFRKDFIREELVELYDADTPAQAVDAIIDMIVVGIGTLHAFGVNARKAWALVHAANMAKSPGTNPRRVNPFGLPDLIKPEGWVAPDHSDNVGTLKEVFGADS